MEKVEGAWGISALLFAKPCGVFEEGFASPTVYSVKCIPDCVWCGGGDRGDPQILPSLFVVDSPQYKSLTPTLCYIYPLLEHRPHATQPPTHTPTHLPTHATTLPLTPPLHPTLIAIPIPIPMLTFVFSDRAYVVLEPLCELLQRVMLDASVRQPLACGENFRVLTALTDVRLAPLTATPRD